MIVVDTHALIWWVNDPDSLSGPARAALETNEIGVSAISCWEVANLARRRRIEIDVAPLEWLRNVFHFPQFVFLPLTLELAVMAGELPDSVRDPADRIIVATALHHGLPLVTKDHKIAGSGVVPTIW